MNVRLLSLVLALSLLLTLGLTGCQPGENASAPTGSVSSENGSQPGSDATDSTASGGDAASADAASGTEATDSAASQTGSTGTASLTYSIPSTPASGEIVIAAAEVTGAVGDVVEVPVTITAGSQVAAIDVDVRFDSGKLEYAGNEDGDFDASAKIDNLMEPGRFRYTMATLTPFTEAGRLFVVKFKIKEGAAGTVPVNVSYETLMEMVTDAEGKITNHQMSAKTVAGSVTVK